MTESPSPTPQPRNFIGGVWHGALLAGGKALADPITVLPAFIDRLTGSTVWVGGFSALMAAAAALPQVVVARFVEPIPRKKPVLLAAIYIRTLAWGALGAMIAWVGPERPTLMLAAMVVLLGIFAAAGALGGVPYVDVIGKVIPRTHRGRFFATREALGRVVAAGSSVLAGVLLKLAYPHSFAALFVGSAAFLFIASFGVLAMREPELSTPPPQPWSAWFASLRSPMRELLPLATVFWTTGVSLLSMPLYVVAARSLGAQDGAIPYFIAANIAGGLLANVLWGRLVDRLNARWMLVACVAMALLPPVLGVIALHTRWEVLIGAMVVVGATQAGRAVGFSSGLLEIATTERRAAYGATFALMGLPVAAMPLLGGVLAKATSFEALFTVTGAAMLGGLAVTVRWAWREHRD